jgi:glutathione S-transferase
VDEVLYCIEDMASVLARSSKIEDQAKKKEIRQAVADGELREWLNRFESMLALNKHGFLVGAFLTIADLVCARRISYGLKAQSLWSYVASFRAGIFDYIDPLYVDQFPLVIAHFQRIWAVRSQFVSCTCMSIKFL